MVEAEKDDWLDDLESPAEQASELDQSDIDALLSGSADLVTPAAGAGPGGQAAAELDQSDIDALLSGTFDQVTPAAASGPGEALAPELDQSDIDALLAGAGDGGGGMDGGDLDQSDIDALLASPQSPAGGQGISDPDQDEIDKLFSDVDSGGSFEETSFPAEEIDFKDVFSTSDTATQSGLPNFDAEEFKLDADIPDIPDIPETSAFDMEATAIFPESAVASPLPASAPPKFDPGPVKASTADHPLPAAKRWNFVANRKALIGVGAGVATLLIVAGVFFFKGGPKPTPEGTTAAVVEHPPVAEQLPPAPAEQAKQPPVTGHTEPPPAEPPPQHIAQGQNGAPTVKDLDLTMPPESSQLAISLCGIDPNNDPLEYEFQSMPEHGQLIGHAPYLVYVPQPDYSGPDGFTIRASDGKNVSAPASVKIMRQPPAPSAKEAPAPAVAAEPVAPPKAVATNKAKARRKTVPVFGDHGGARSKAASLPARQNHAPVIALQPVAPIYAPGETVVLNAGQTTDDRGDTLTFHWVQVAGVQVKINPASSLISFVAPSFFNTVSDPRLVFQVTATDQEGAQDRREISIAIRSQRTSAVWGLHE
jgi:hypothetical protein